MAYEVASAPEDGRTSSPAGSPTIDGSDVRVFTVPLDPPESDGTMSWDSTTAVVVTVYAGNERGIGYTYGDAAVAALIESKLADLIRGAEANAPAALNAAMQRELRNAGRPGIGAMAISAVDIALWDLKARLLGVPLADLLPRFHERVPIYGSGGFTSYGPGELAEQLRGWVDAGIPRVKIKVGRDPDRDPERLSLARRTVGDDVELFVDANGAFTPKEALAWAQQYTEYGRLLVRGAGLLGGSGGPAAASRPRPGGYGDRRRRVRVGFASARGIGGLRRCPAGGRHPLRRHHEPAQGRRDLQGAQHEAVGSLRAGGQRPRLCRGRDMRPHRVFPRSRPGRACVVRRDP